MGFVRTRLMLANPVRSDLASIDVDGSVDTGELEWRTVPLADSSTQHVPYSGPIKTTFSSRSCFTGAMVLGDEVLLGSIPMEDMDLIARPLARDCVPNPASLNFPASIAKGTPWSTER